MPSKSPTTSEPAEESSSDPSVLDFLYHDSRRIGSFLAQFEIGHLQQLTQTKDSARGRERATETKGKGGVPGFAEASHGTSDTVSRSVGEGTQRQYDPYWSNARAFLDYANDHGLLISGVENARIGQLVLATGDLGIVDIKTLQSAWDSKAIQGKMREGMGGGANAPTHTAAHKAAKREADETFQFMIEMLKIMPYAVQAMFRTQDGDRLWGTLSEENLVTSPGDLALKHGILIEGEWSVVGILDAEATHHVDDDDYEHHAQMAAIQTMSLMGGSPISQVALHVAPAAKLLLGRPSSSYGITPLLIFRTISA